VAPSRFDATIAFYRENGVEPTFDFVGPRAKCPICRALKATSPHSMAVVLTVGIPHIQCSHRWRGRTTSSAKLAAGGLRPGKISAGAGPTAGIIGSEPLSSRLRRLDEGEIAAAINSGTLADLAKAAFEEAEHPRDPLTGEFISIGSALDDLASALDSIPNDKPTQPGGSLEEVLTANERARASFKTLLDLGRGLEERLGAEAYVEPSLPRFVKGAAKLRATDRPIVVIPPMKTADSAAKKLLRKDYGFEGLADINRASVLVPNLDGLPTAVEGLKAEAAAQGWTLHDVKDRFNGSATEDGYRDLQLHLVSPAGDVTEIQFHLNELWAAKFERGHLIYEEIRMLDELGRALTAAEKRLRAKLVRESIAVYGPAWEAILGASGAPPP
jgi:hypothetical protein